MKDSSQILRNSRVLIFLAVSTLISIGIVVLYSSSAVYAYEKFGDNFFFLKRHIAWLAMGFLLGLLFMRIDINALRRFSKYLMAISILLLILVLVPAMGLTIGGASRWLKVGGAHFQPIEFVKLFFLIYIADLLDRKALKKNAFAAVFLPAVIITGAVCGLLLLQPDLGSAVELVLIGLAMLFVNGAKLKHLLVTAIACMPAAFLLIAKSPYRLMRVLAFMDPMQDPQGAGFQILQSFIALGSGGLFGVGLGGSTQKLFYLPEAHTDFIFSIIGEELGFLGGVSVICLFLVLIACGIRIAVLKGSEFSRLLAFGITFLISLEVLINIGVVSGALPTKGLPLPFLSYGGSSLVAHMMLVSVLLNLGRDHVR